MKYLNPKTWLIAAVKAIAISKLKKAVNSHGGELMKWSARIRGYITKTNMVLAFLDRVAAKLEDGELTDMEANEAILDAKVLAQEVTE